MPAGRRDREGSPMAVHRDQEVSPTGNSPFFYRSAGACPPRSPLASYVFRSYGPEENKKRFFRSANTGEGQALALR